MSWNLENDNIPGKSRPGVDGLTVGQDSVAELVEALEPPLRDHVLQHLLGALAVGDGDALDEEGDEEVVAGAGGGARQLVVVVYAHLAELGRAVHDASNNNIKC
jgi:hypothetical protein